MGMREPDWTLPGSVMRWVWLGKHTQVGQDRSHDHTAAGNRPGGRERGGEGR